MSGFQCWVHLLSSYDSIGNSNSPSYEITDLRIQNSSFILKTIAKPCKIIGNQMNTTTLFYQNLWNCVLVKVVWQPKLFGHGLCAGSLQMHYLGFF